MAVQASPDGRPAAPLPGLRVRRWRQPAQESARQGTLRQLHLPPPVRTLRLGTPRHRAVGPRQGPEQAADQGGIPVHKR